MSPNSLQLVRGSWFPVAWVTYWVPLFCRESTCAAGYWFRAAQIGKDVQPVRIILLHLAPESRWLRNGCALLPQRKSRVITRRLTFGRKACPAAYTWGFAEWRALLSAEDIMSSGMGNWARTAAARSGWMTREPWWRRMRREGLIKLAGKPPWSVEETDACFIVRDVNGQAQA
jgi:hypothetical protein